jgi:hypothetical protein
MSLLGTIEHHYIKLVNLAARRRRAINSDVRLSVAELSISNLHLMQMHHWLKSIEANEIENLMRNGRYDLIKHDFAVVVFGKLAPVRFQYAACFGEICFVILSELMRRNIDTHEDSLWRIAKSVFGSDAQRFLFGLNEQPSPDFRRFLERSITGGTLRLIHRFGEQGTQEWSATFAIQYGFTKSDSYKFSTLLRSKSKRNNLDWLFNNHVYFQQFWNTCQILQNERCSANQIRDYLVKSPFILGEWVPDIVEQLTSETTSITERAVAEETSQDVVTARITLSDDSKLLLNLDFSIVRLLQIFSADDDLRIFIDERSSGWLRRSDDGLNFIGKSTQAEPLSPSNITCQVRFQGDTKTYTEDIVVWYSGGGPVLFDQVSGDFITSDTPLKHGRQYIVIASSDLTLSDSLERYSFSEFAISVFRADRDITARLIDQNSLITHTFTTNQLAGHDVQPLTDLGRILPLKLEVALESEFELQLTTFRLEGIKILSVRIDGRPANFKKSDKNTSNWIITNIVLGAGLASTWVTVRVIADIDSRKRVHYEGKIELPLVGAQIKRKGLWQPIYKNDLFSASELEDSPLKVLGNSALSTVLFDGFRPVCPMSPKGLRINKMLAGWGEEITIRDSTLNGKRVFKMSNSSVNTGLILHAVNDESAGRLILTLKREDDLSGYDVVIWYPSGGWRIVPAQNICKPLFAGNLIEYNMPLSDSGEQAVVVAFAYDGQWIGAFWNLDDLAWQRALPVAQADRDVFLMLIRWCRIPFLYYKTTEWFLPYLLSSSTTLNAFLYPQPIAINGKSLVSNISSSEVSDHTMAMRVLADQYTAIFAKYICEPGNLAQWMTPMATRGLFEIHPHLYLTLYQNLAGKMPIFAPDVNQLQNVVIPSIDRWLTITLADSFVMRSLENWLSASSDDPTLNFTIHTLLCNREFSSWAFSAVQR